MSVIKINILEVASELADKDLNENYRDSNLINGKLTYYDNHCEYYNDKAQDQFNELYDKWYGFLEEVIITT